MSAAAPTMYIHSSLFSWSLNLIRLSHRHFERIGTRAGLDGRPDQRKRLEVQPKVANIWDRWYVLKITILRECKKSVPL
jgi:hypothetical protein